jgi:hypothetical protein
MPREANLARPPPVAGLGSVAEWFAPRGQQERDDRVGETVWILPEEKMAQFREDDELGAWDAVREQFGVARIDHGVRGAMQDQRPGADACLP